MIRNPRTLRDFRVIPGGSALMVAGSAALVLLASGCAEKQEPAGGDVLARTGATNSSPSVRQPATSSPPAPLPNDVREKMRALGYADDSASSSPPKYAEGGPPPMDEATREHLKSLGYIDDIQPRKGTPGPLAQNAVPPPPAAKPEIEEAVRQKLEGLSQQREGKPGEEWKSGFAQPSGRSFELYKDIIGDRIPKKADAPAAAAPPRPTAMAEPSHESLKALGYLDGGNFVNQDQNNLPFAKLQGATIPEAPAAAAAAAKQPTANIRIAPTPRPENTERYQQLEESPLHTVANDPVSTFSLDVDTGSYSNVRRFLVDGDRPPEDAVRIEELVNYFPYDYPRSTGSDPFGIRTELAPCPWKSDHWLMRVAVKADEVNAKEMPPVNLVFLVDVSGSMDDPVKLPLLQKSLKLLAQQLRPEDRVGMVVYAGREAVVLESTPGDQHAKIEGAIDALSAGGSTAGEAGLRGAYRVARASFIKGGINRVLLATDGDFNVGTSNTDELKRMVEQERESGVQLSTLGFGTGNYNEGMMEQIADVGNGAYAYIDTLQEGRKVLVDQMRSTMVTVAKDVKVQVEFNPAVVAEYRLIGYENRVLATEDFNNDRIDAGDVGAGQSVTALYELTPVGAATAVDPLRYGAPKPQPEAPVVATNEVAFVKIRYKQPNATTSKLVTVPVERTALLASFDNAGDDFRFATAVAGFGQLLRGGKRTGTWSWDEVLSTATSSRGKDEYGYRSEFLNLVRMAKITG